MKITAYDDSGNKLFSIVRCPLQKHDPDPTDHKWDMVETGWAETEPIELTGDSIAEALEEAIEIDNGKDGYETHT